MIRFLHRILLGLDLFLAATAIAGGIGLAHRAEVMTELVGRRR